MIARLADFDLIGLPRLVRLNPNVPWKTRGNAAISMAFGEGRGRRILVGEIDGEKIVAHLSGKGGDLDEILARAGEVIEKTAHFSCERTNPGLVVSNTRPPLNLYWRAVREIIPLADAEKAVSAVGGNAVKFKNGRGVIGASAAMAWRPRDRTFELITYREPHRVGTLREVDHESVARMDREFSSTFHNLDLEKDHLAITPASPCPVLYGIRGDDPMDLPKAKDTVKAEPISRWLIFLTNQATDEHILRRKINQLTARQGAVIRGTVTEPAIDLPGGHVLFGISDGLGDITCAVYEPSGAMRNAARALVKGDILEVYGSIRREPFELNVEKLNIVSPSRAMIKVENPICPECNRHMKSIGKGAGFRCRKCGIRVPETSALHKDARKLTKGWHEPPICSRRHLYKPVSRIGIKRTPLREILYMWPGDECAENTQTENTESGCG